MPFLSLGALRIDDVVWEDTKAHLADRVPQEGSKWPQRLLFAISYYSLMSLVGKCLILLGRNFRGS
jgi:hypothetical protein